MSGKSLLDLSRREKRAREPQTRLSERREKGLWSFLTWSFFLSQVVGAEQVAAGAAQTAAAADDRTPASDTAGQASGIAFLPLEPGVPAGTDESTISTFAQAAFGEAEPTLSLVSAQDETAMVTRLGASGDGPAATPTSASHTTATSTQATVPDSNPDGPGADTPLPAAGVASLLSLGPIVDPIGEVVGDVVEQVVGIVGDVVGDVVQVLDPVVEQLVAPVAGIVGDVVGDVVQVLDPVVEQLVAPVAGIVGDVVGDVVQVLDPVVEQLVAPVAGIVGDVVGDVVQVLDPVVEQLVAPVAGIAGDVVGDVVQVLDPVVEQLVAPVAGIVGDVVGDVVQVLDPVVEQVIAPVNQVLAPVADVLGDLLGLGSSGGAPILTASVAASSTSIDFEVGPAGGSLPLDDLFSGGRYSDYNLALQAEASVGANPAPGETLPDLDIAAEVSALTGNTPSDGWHGSQGSSHHLSLPGLLGNIGLHGLGL